jgi:hypothetical protein
LGWAAVRRAQATNGALMSAGAPGGRQPASGRSATVSFYHRSASSNHHRTRPAHEPEIAPAIASRLIAQPDAPAFQPSASDSLDRLEGHPVAHLSADR